ncbi:putative MFS family arabinose efflux permease [Thermosporothrix hazakensis]|uniref:Putative MFS family arabinose efflux permease n=1 Tax=Thermosporothrix hazakensis TaxID=644383 RepID=A0A326UFD9_THEHA|nr:MFS transporter [Thermosporothrix hazakensis]PZW36581.1 putative MFS family arabinose efflux permease [Thermosporothrix hazakensis]GCE47232.1 MFS transporter [Thermosporothrix hazakensis]
MFAALAKKNYTLLWLGQVVSMIGDWFLVVALPFYIYQLTGSVLQTGIMYIVELLPRVLLGPVVGVFLDRWDKRKIMMITDLLRAVILLLMLLVRSADFVWIIYVVTILQAVMAQLFVPASMALIPMLVEKEQLIGANALSSFSESVTRLIGPPLGGAMLALLGLSGVVIADSVTYLFSACCIMLMAVQSTSKGQEAVVASGNALKRLWSELLEGLVAIKQSKVVVGIFVIMGIMMVGQGLMNVMLVPFIEQMLHADAMAFSWLLTAQGAGTLLGALLVSTLTKKVKPVILVSLGLISTGCTMLLLAFFPNLWLALGAIAIIGVLLAGCMVSIQTLLQISVDERYRGRVFSSFETIISLTMLVGLLASSGIGDRVGPAPLIAANGALAVIAALVSLWLLRSARFSEEATLSGAERVPVVE